MKNIILITEDGEQLIASTDDGTNQLIINDTVIPSADWVGTGTYTATIQGHNISIAKSPDLNGIIQIIRLSPYNYALKKAKQPWQPEQTTVTVDVGSTTTGAAGTDAVVTNSGDEVNVILDFVIPRGNKGDKGDAGADGSDGVDGNGIADVTLNADYTLTFDFTDGTSYTTPVSIRGAKGDTGASAGFGTPTASVDANTGTPSVTVTASGSDTAKVFDFAFHNLKGAKGDTFTYDDLTPAQIASLKQDVSTFYKKDESYYNTTTSGQTTIPIGINGFRSTDILLVDINGLDLITNVDYVISGQNIVLTTGISEIGTPVHFVALRCVEVTAQDYSALKGDDGDVSDVQVDGTSIVNQQGVANINPAAFLDFFYRVGSYYETSDSTFDPNVEWGGTWELETEGQVHVSAGTNYTVSGALTNISDGGNKDAIVPYHRHGVGSISISSSGEHVHSGSRRNVFGSGSTAGFVSGTATNSDISVTQVTRSTTMTGSVGAHAHSVPSHNTNYVGTDGNVNNANMQPYIVVYRWHRTA